MSSNDRPSPSEVLETNGRGQYSPTVKENQRDTSTERSRRAIRAFVDAHVAEKKIITARSIANAVDIDIRPQEIGKALGAKRIGTAPEGWLDDMEISLWRDTRPRKYVFDRVAGEGERTPGYGLRKVDLVRAIDATLPESAPDPGLYETVGGGEKVRMPIAWMHAVVDAVCAHLGYDPDLGSDEDRHETTLADLTRVELTSVLESATGITDAGYRTNWNKATCQCIYALLIADRPLSEVVQ